MNYFYEQRKMSGFWNCIKNTKRKKVNSTLSAEEFGIYYDGIMNTQMPYSHEHRDVEDFVHSKFH